MPPDLIVYALVAAGLIFWLRSILGTRHGDERERPDPFTSAPESTVDTAKDHNFVSEERGYTPEERIMELASKPTSTLSVENKTAENGLLEISRADKNFDIIFFLEAAQEAFVMVVEAFAEGDREMLKDLLDDKVYTAFETALAERETSGETLGSEIHAIRRAEVTGARLEGKKAFVTVRFTADETNVTKDKDGEILSGNPDKVTEMIDIWTFGREIKSRDPRWFLYETRGDFDDDNDTVPNSHE